MLIKQIIEVFDLLDDSRVNGQKVKVVGRIGMTHTVVDVTKLECRPGDKAVMDVDPINVKGIQKIYR